MSRVGIIFLCALLLVCAVNAKFIKLTDDNIDDKLTHGDWLILFDDASEHTVEEAQWIEVGKLAKETGSTYKIGRVDCDTYPDACYDRQLKSKDLPKAFFYVSGESLWQQLPFAGKSAKEVLDGVEKVLHGDVTVLTKASFNETVLSGGKPWLVEFYAPWCGHCKELAPSWKQLATDAKVSGDFQVAKVDCAANGDLCTNYSVNGYPTIKLFKEGVVYDYKGPRTAPGFKDFVANPPKEPEFDIEYVDETGEDVDETGGSVDDTGSKVDDGAPEVKPAETQKDEL